LFIKFSKKVEQNALNFVVQFVAQFMNGSRLRDTIPQTAEKWRRENARSGARDGTSVKEILRAPLAAVTVK
jgi:hypothetical protein